MKKIRIEKLVCNIGCGSQGSVDNSKKILEALTNTTAIVIKTKKRTTFGVPKGKEIGCKVTIRKNIDKLLDRLFDAHERLLKSSNFDTYGNFAFGIKEHISIPDIDYEPSLGIIGMDICVTLERPGYSVKRKAFGSKVGKKHMITKEEGMKFIQENFNVQVEE